MHPPGEPDPLAPPASSMADVPRLAWSDLFEPGGDPTEGGAAAFGSALRDIGFAIVVGAPFRADLLDRNYALMERVFALGPETNTREHSHPEIGYQRGYMPTRTEFGLRCGGDPDDKEVVAWGSYHNVDVPAVPGYRETAEGYYRACQSVGYDLMRLLARFLDPEGEETDYVLGLFRDARGVPTDDSHMRHIKYPATARRMACAHTDSNMLSLLPAATRGGLEVLAADGGWRAVETARGDLVVNAGDMLNFLSGGVIRSTLHRVENKISGGAPHRFSMPFFYHPDHAQELRVLRSCRNTPRENRMFPWETITGYRLLHHLLATYKVIPPEIAAEDWIDSMETLKRDGFPAAPAR
ncbi:MAG: 2OG-Fe(II) oxygenase family protein [Armatimonadota bacterium]